MKIAFEADMLKQFLVEAGIDSNDAKAIVYDLMLISQDGSIPRKPRQASVQRVQPQVQVQNPEPDPEPAGDGRTVVNRQVTPVMDFQEPEVQPQPQPQVDRSKVRTHKRLNFQQFGGKSTPLKE